MKKKLLTIGIIAICLAVIGSGTIAFFTGSDTANNIITTGGAVDVEVIEKMDLGNGVLDKFPEGGIKGIMPGDTVSKIVTLQNSGASTAWIRVRVTEQIQSAAGAPLSLTTRTGEPVMTYAIDSDLWLYSDGWYYYKSPVSGGASTAVLFKNVFFSKAMTNEYVNATAHVTIHAQAVQTANNGDHVMEAEGWPSEVVD